MEEMKFESRFLDPRAQTLYHFELCCLLETSKTTTKTLMWFLGPLALPLSDTLPCHWQFSAAKEDRSKPLWEFCVGMTVGHWYFWSRPCFFQLSSYKVWSGHRKEYPCVFFEFMISEQKTSFKPVSTLSLSSLIRANSDIGWHFLSLQEGGTLC